MILARKHVHPRKPTCPRKRGYFKRKYIHLPTFDFQGTCYFSGGVYISLLKNAKILETLTGKHIANSVMNPNMDVSENNGTPKSSISIGFSIINHPFWGTLILGNTQFCMDLPFGCFNLSGSRTELPAVHIRNRNQSLLEIGESERGN